MIGHAAVHATRVIEVDDGLFVIGADAAGHMLGLVARPEHTGELLVFHAMPLRSANAKRYLS